MGMRKTLGLMFALSLSRVALSMPALAQGGYLNESLTAQEGIESAVLLLRENRVADAVTALDRIVAEHTMMLLPTPDGSFADTQLRIRSLIASDERLLASYREQNGAAAQRALALAVEAGPSAAELERVLYRYNLTRSGLDAALMLGGLYLERTDVSSAASVLREVANHPDLSQRAADYERLSAMIAAMLGDGPQAEAHRLAIEKIDPADAARLSPILQALLNRHRTDEAVATAAELPRRDSPLWSVTIREMPALDMNNPAAQQQRQAMANMPGPIPQIAGATVLLNTVERVVALDRDSGREIWRQNPASEAENANTRAEDNLMRAGVYNMHMARGSSRGVAVSGQRAYAVIGTSNAILARFGQMANAGSSTQTRLVSLELATGNEMWAATPRDLGVAELDDADFIGTPVAEGGRVYALLARVKGTSLDTFAACVEADSGRVLWTRHVAGASTMRRQFAESSAGLLVADGRLYVCDDQSGVAAIDARTGSVRWARLLEETTPGGQRNVVHHNPQQASRVATPMLLRAGLLVPIGPKDDLATLLDPETGQVKRRLNRDLANDTQWVMVDGDAISVGPNLVCYDGRDMSVKWRATLEGTSTPINGAVSVGSGAVLIPGANGLALHSLKDGKPIKVISSIKGGGTAIADGVIICAQAETAYGIDDWERARDRLLALATQDTADPAPGLALAHLALRRNEDATAIQAVDLAMLALDERILSGLTRSQDPVQAAVFDQLLVFTDASQGGSDALRAQIFDRIAAITTDTADEVAYHLALGGFYSESKIANYEGAIEHYHAVLFTPDLANQVYGHGGYERHAGLEARRRMARLVQEQGPEIYAKFDALAATELQRLLASGATSDHLIALAMRYPLASTAARAHYEAGLRLINEGDTGGTVNQFRLAFEYATDDTLRAAAAGELAAFYQQRGQPRQAIRWLDRVAVERPGLMVIREGQPVAVSAWVADLAHMPFQPEPLPRLGSTLGTPQRLPGRMIRPLDGNTAELADRILTVSSKQLRFFAAADQALLWERTIEAEDVVALSVSRDQVLLWSPSRSELLAFNGRTGEPDWPTRFAGALFEEITEDDRLPDDKHRADPDLLEMLRANANPNQNAAHVIRMQQQARQGAPARAQEAYTIRANQSAVCIADSGGQVIGIDRYTGSVLWRLQSPIQRLHNMTLGPDAVAISGRASGADAAHAGRLLIIDLITGQPRIPMQHMGDQLPRWAVFAGDAKFIMLDGREILAYDLKRGSIAWRASQVALNLTGTGWASDRVIVMPDNQGVAHMIDPDTGEVRQSVSAQAQQRAAPSSARIHEGTAYLLSPRAAIAASTEGNLLWQDAVEPDVRSFIGQYVGERHIALLAYVAARPGDNEPAAYHAFLVDREGGQLVAEYRLSDELGRIDPDASAVVDGHLVLSTDRGLFTLSSGE